MDELNSYNLNINKNDADKDKEIYLSDEDRAEFKDKFEIELQQLEREQSLLEETNSLINEALESDEDDPTSPLINDPLEKNPLYKQMDEDYKRRSLLDNDPTGKKKKAAGEDI